MGPLEYLTSYANPDHIAGEDNYNLPQKVAIPEEYLDLLNEKFKQKDELNTILREFKRIHEWIVDEAGKEKLLTLSEPIQDLSEEHIEKMWQRVEEMIKFGVFISSENREFVLDGG
jgi:predicted translin family RNA/ssDNA-binding protein